jgi:Short C-terminal domain
VFGRKKKKAQSSIAGLPSVDVSILDTPSTSASVTPNVSSPPPNAPASPSAPDQAPPADGSIPPIHTTMTFDGGTTVIDARNVPGLRQELLDVIGHGGNPAEIQDLVMKAMSQGHAVTGSSPLTPGAITPPSPPAEDPLDRLKRLNDLRISGALTDAEFEAEKKKILG